MGKKNKEDMITVGAIYLLANMRPDENIQQTSFRVGMTYSHTSQLITMMATLNILKKKTTKGRRSSEITITEKGLKMQRAAQALVDGWKK